MGMMNRFNQFFSLSQEDSYEDFSEISSEELSEMKDSPSRWKEVNPVNSSTMNVRKEQKPIQQNVVSLNQPTIQKKITICEPRYYSEVKEIADILLKQQAVVLSFVRMEKEEAKKTVDFLMGTIHAINGDMQRVGDEIFICTPKDIEIDGVLKKNNNFSDNLFQQGREFS